MALQRGVVLGVLVLLGLGVDWAALPIPQDTLWPLELTFLLGLLLLISHVTGNLAADFGLPRITGYIVAGLLVGPSGVELVTDADVASLALIDQVAIALIAFSAGAELKIREVREAGRVIASILVSEMALVFVAVAGLVLLLKPVFPLTAGQGWTEAIIIADRLHLEILLTALTTGFFVENISEVKADRFV
ncbi:MAG: cation:proton antiporter, partial [Gemmatimonadetes bacterium]|nr:cation:proton antiporter [Gemmatimonadota bacterium]